MIARRKEVFISVDVETAGPIPGEYSMLEIGACVAERPDIRFACKLKPTSSRADPNALAVTGLSLAELKESGIDPAKAMAAFAAWIAGTVGDEGEPVFVGFNAPFDWSFVNYYFHRFLGKNPFGFAALDIKALYMGAANCDWRDTRSSRIAERLQPTLVGDHDALHDALYQAELFRLVLNLRNDDRNGAK
jgi:DNA polymerase III epsilon subunit-like protein